MLKRQTSVVELIRQKSEGDQSLSYQQNFLSVIVVGASGDLAKKRHIHRCSNCIAKVSYRPRTSVYVGTPGVTIAMQLSARKCETR